MRGALLLLVALAGCVTPQTSGLGQTSDVSLLVSQGIMNIREMGWRQFRRDNSYTQKQIEAQVRPVEDLLKTHLARGKVRFNYKEHVFSILPDSSTELGRLALQIADKANAELIYSLYEVFAHPYAAASYSWVAPKRMLLSDQAIVSLKASDNAVVHELTHFNNWEELYSGKSKWYHGSLIGGPVAPGKYYFDEIVAYRQDVVLAATRLAEFARSLRPEQVLDARFGLVYHEVFETIAEDQPLEILEFLFKSLSRKVLFLWDHLKPLGEVLPFVKANLEELDIVQSRDVSTRFFVINAMFLFNKKTTILSFYSPTRVSDAKSYFLSRLAELIEKIEENRLFETRTRAWLFEVAKSQTFEARMQLLLKGPLS